MIMKKKKPTSGTNKSQFDPTRNTVGSIYRELQVENRMTEGPVAGDMTHEMMKGYVEDLNEALCSKKETDDPFFVMVHEKKDLQMKSAILRRIIIFPFRPYPEDATTVFWKNPKNDDVRFCWDLPHWSEMDNILANKNDYDTTLIAQIIYWKNNDLTAFGFSKDKKIGWVPNPLWIDKKIKRPSLVAAS